MISTNFTGLKNGVVHHARIFTMNQKGQAQSEIGTQTACAKPVDGQPVSSLTVGDMVSLNVGGVPTRFVVVHKGLPSSLYDVSCDGVWLLMENLYSKFIWDQANNDYANSDIHFYLNNAFFDLFDADTKAQIKRAKLPFRSGTGSGGTTATGASGLSTNIFLLGGYEMGWTTSNNSYFPVDGARLSYFGTASTDSKRVGRYNGAVQNTWLRSAYTANTANTWYVNTAGGCASANVSYSYYIRPALILESSTMVSNTQNANGSYTVL